MNITRRLSLWMCTAAALGGSHAFVLAQGPPPHRNGGPGMGHGPGPGPGPMMENGGGRGDFALVTGAPYTGLQILQSQQTLGNGIQIQHQQQTKVYRDGKGRVRTESTLNSPGGGGNGGTSETSIMILDPSARSVVRLVPQSAVAYRGGGGPPPMMRRGEGGGPPPFFGGDHQFPQQVTDLGSKTINGLTATGKRVSFTIPAGVIGNNLPIPVFRETWVSTELRVPVQITSSDPRFGSSTMQLTNIVRGEPDPALFVIPADYRVVEEFGGGREFHGGPPPGSRGDRGPGERRRPMPPPDYEE